MTLSWRSETADAGNVLVRHPAAHWWYTLEQEANAAGRAEAASLLALDLADMEEGHSAEADSEELAQFSASLVSPEQSRSLHRGMRPEGVDRVLRGLLSRAREGHEDHTLFAPVLPEGARCDGPADPSALPFEVPQVPKDSTVIGIIDDGIAFAHPAFRMGDGAGTRFAAVWQQDAAGLRGEQSDVPFGHVFSRAEIDQRLEAAGYDEDRFYRDLPRASAAQRVPFQQRKQHGTHVLDLAAGNGRGDGMDQTPESFPILAVNLPTALVSDTAGTFMASAVILGLRDIMRRTEAMMKRADSAFPLVVNLSFGLGGAGKNGGHLIAAALEKAMAYWQHRHNVPMRVVLPSGNTMQSKLVARARVSTDRPHHAVVHVAPDNLGSTYVEIALKKRQKRRPMAGLSVTLSRPKGCGSLPLPVPAASNPTSSVQMLIESTQDDTGAVRELAQCAIYYGFQRDLAPEHSRAGRLGVEVITIALPPNAARDPHRPLPPCGDWGVSIALAPGEIEPQDIEIRVLRNDVPNRVLPVRQRSWLKDPAYRAFRADGFPETALVTEGCSITRSHTLNALSGGSTILTVGSSYLHRERMAEYSSAGPGAALAEGATVSLHAPGEETPGLIGRRAAGYRGGAYQRLGGTSMAAPQVTRRIALALAKWHVEPMGRPASFAPISDFVERGPQNIQEQTGVGGIA